MYIDKLRQQRQKIESVSSHYQALKEELDRKDLQLAEKDRRMAALAETVVSKRKYEELMRELKICERERDKARGQLEQLKV
jgi:chromosome segregation ATPase